MFRILFLPTPGTSVLFKMTDAWRGSSLGFNFCQVYHLFAGFQHGGSPVPLRCFFVRETFCLSYYLRKLPQWMNYVCVDGSNLEEALIPQIILWSDWTIIFRPGLWLADSDNGLDIRWSSIIVTVHPIIQKPIILRPGPGLMPGQLPWGVNC